MFTESNSTVQINTDKIPVKAGIDPYLVLIDREMDNNICEVKKTDDLFVSFLSELPFKSKLLNSLAN